MVINSRNCNFVSTDKPMLGVLNQSKREQIGALP